MPLQRFAASVAVVLVQLAERFLEGRGWHHHPSRAEGAMPFWPPEEKFLQSEKEIVERGYLGPFVCICMCY